MGVFLVLLPYFWVGCQGQFTENDCTNVADTDCPGGMCSSFTGQLRTGQSGIYCGESGGYYSVDGVIGCMRRECCGVRNPFTECASYTCPLPLWTDKTTKGNITCSDTTRGCSESDCCDLDTTKCYAFNAMTPISCPEGKALTPSMTLAGTDAATCCTESLPACSAYTCPDGESPLASPNATACVGGSESRRRSGIMNGVAKYSCGEECCEKKCSTVTCPAAYTDDKADKATLMPTSRRRWRTVEQYSDCCTPKAGTCYAWMVAGNSCPAHQYQKMNDANMAMMGSDAATCCTANPKCSNSRPAQASTAKKSVASGAPSSHRPSVTAAAALACAIAIALAPLVFGEL